LDFHKKQVQRDSCNYLKQTIISRNSSQTGKIKVVIHQYTSIQI